MPSDKEYIEAETNLASYNNKVDYIVSHTAPTETIYYLSKLGDCWIDLNVLDERPLNDFIQMLTNCVSYQKHYFGHFHIDKMLFRNQIAIYNSIRDLITGEIIHQWDSYFE